MDLCLCICERRGRSGECPFHRRALRAVACLSADSDMSHVSACFSAGDHMDLRLCMFESRRRYGQRRRLYGLSSLHIAAPAVIWTYACACLSAGESLKAIWDDVEGHMDLRFCMLQSRLPYGLTFLHVRAPGESDGHMDLRFCISQRRWSYGRTFLHVRAPGEIRLRYGGMFMHVSAPMII